MQPLVLESVTREAGMGLSRLYSRDISGSFACGGTKYLFKAGWRRAVFVPALSATLDLGGNGCVLELEDQLFISLPAPFSSIDQSALSDEVRAMVLEALLAEPLAALESRLGKSAVVTGVTAGPTDGGPPLTLTFLIGDPQTKKTVFARLRFDTPLLDLLWNACSALPEKITPEADSLPLRGSLQIGRSRLRVSELRALDALDVLLIEEPAGQEGELALVFPGGPAFKALVSADIITIKRTLPMDQNDPQPAPAEASVDTVEVDCVFEVGSKTMTVAELRAVAPGLIVSLDKPLDGPVTLVANGRALARCELLDIEGTLAVRVVSLGDPCK